MDGKNPDLASRFRAALDEVEQARAREQEERGRRLAEGAAARETLFGELEAFAGAIGHVAARRDVDGVVLRYGERALRFEPVGDADQVRVRVEGWPGASEHRITRERDLADRWVLVFRKHAREERFPLFDRGLEELLVEGLGLPRPEALPERPMSPRTAEALVAPAAEAPLRVVGAPERGRAPQPDAPDDAEAAPKGPRPRRL